MKTKLPLFLIAIVVLSLFNVQGVLAQHSTTTMVKYERINDSTRLSLMDKYATAFYGIVVDSATKDPIQSAVVYLVGTASGWGKDLISRSVVTDKQGRFEILVSGDSKLEVSCLGYKLYTQRVAPPSTSRGIVSRASIGTMHNERPSVDLGKIALAPDLFNADEAVVKARIQMFEQRGDTTRIFPKLVKTMEGDALIEVLRQIPGFKIEDDGSIYENGRKIERTYVNNTLLFGKDPRLAFLKLSAESALAIDTYEEKVDETEAALTNRSKEENTRRVANVTTTRKISSYTIMEWLAESGLDHDKDIDGSRNVRYGLSGDIGFYEVGKQLSMDISHSNMVAQRSFSGDNIYIQNGNPQNTSIGIAYNGQLGDSVYNEQSKRNVFDQKGYINSQYTYTNRRHTNRSSSFSTYFPSINFDSQIIETANMTKSKSQRHYALISYTGTGANVLPLTISLTPSFEKNEYFTESQNTTITDEELLSKTNQNNKSTSKPIRIEGSISTHKNLYRKDINSYRKDIKPSDILNL
ncbi:MAG: carboxypeptidase regulatory-like domain-containing protein, partial [Rikenellaceae bacterium]|nr:carboxypeptidase regulatory-like domain-containing protein [Rikenellaceae bacterium]